MTIGTQEIGQDVRVASVALARRAISRTSGFHDIRMDRNDVNAGIDQTIDEDALRSFDCQPRLLELLQSFEQLIDAEIRVLDFEMSEYGSPVVDDADGMRSTRPIQTNEMHRQLLTSVIGSTLPTGRVGSSLTGVRPGPKTQRRNVLWPISPLGALRYAAVLMRAVSRLACWAVVTKGLASTPALAMPADLMVHQ